jgi:hypothetical protein
MALFNPTREREMSLRALQLSVHCCRRIKLKGRTIPDHALNRTSLFILREIPVNLHVFLIALNTATYIESIIANLESENEESIRNHLMRVKKEDAPE